METIIIPDIEKDRYSRFEIIPWWDQAKLKKSRVMVIGAGALGNECLKNLALLGVGYIYICDFDVIVNADLTRSILYREEDEGCKKVDVAAKRIKEINPEITIEVCDGDVIWDIGIGVFRRMDVIIGCVDNREARLAINESCWRVNRPWIDGGIDVFYGSVGVFVPSSKKACYECTLTEKDYQLLRIHYACPLLRYDDLVTGRIPTTPTIASIIGGIQVQETIKIIHGMDVPAGKGIIFNSLTYDSYVVEYPIKKDCLSHEEYRDIVELKEGVEMTFNELFSIAKLQLGEEVQLKLNKDLVTYINFPCCKGKKRIFKLLGKTSISDGRCPNCGELGAVEIIQTIDHDNEEIGRLSLKEIGIPSKHIIPAQNDQSTIYFEVG